MAKAILQAVNPILLSQDVKKSVEYYVDRHHNGLTFYYDA